MNNISRHIKQGFESQYYNVGKLLNMKVLILNKSCSKLNDRCLKIPHYA